MPRKPLSDEQLAANRANARKSTGPRTPQGKARSAQNARKHGFTASTFSVVRLEELDEVDRLKADLVALYQPVNSQELFAVERIALAQQALLRAARLESGLFTTALDHTLATDGDLFIPMGKELTSDIEITRAQNRNFALAFGFHKMAGQANTWSLFLRYQAQAERHYRRAIEEFERLQALRDRLPPELPNEANSAPQSEENNQLPPCETNPFSSPAGSDLPLHAHALPASPSAATIAPSSAIRGSPCGKSECRPQVNCIVSFR